MPNKQLWQSRHNHLNHRLTFSTADSKPEDRWPALSQPSSSASSTQPEQKVPSIPASWGTKITQKQSSKDDTKIRERYEKYFQVNRILPIPELVHEVQPKIISFVVTDLKTKRLAGIKKDTFEGSGGVSLLIGRGLDADVDVVFADDGGRLVVADVAVKSFKFRLVAVYAPNFAAERVSFFRRLAPSLGDTKRLVLMGDWNAILDPKIDKVRRGASRLGRCESSLAGLMTRHDLVDRFRLDNPGQEMWTWLDSSPSAKVGSYLDRADIDFVSCPTFHLIAWTDHKLVWVSLRLANRPSLAGYGKFNTSLLEMRALVRAVTGNRWWGSLKHRIRDFATKYGQQLNLDRTKEAKSIDDRLSRSVAGGGDFLTVELARGDLERESSERYKGYVVRSRLKRVLNEAVKTNATTREEVRRFPDRYIDSVKTPDGRLQRSSHEMRDAFRAHFRDRFARCTDLTLREFRSYLADFHRLGGLKRLVARVWSLNAKSMTR